MGLRKDRDHYDDLDWKDVDWNDLIELKRLQRDLEFCLRGCKEQIADLKRKEKLQNQKAGKENWILLIDCFIIFAVILATAIILVKCG